MKTLLMASMATLSMAFAPTAMAQSPSSTPGAPVTEQRSDYDSWPPERQRMYDAMDRDMQSYYWSLQPNEQAGWWALNNEQRARLHAMTPQQQAAAWNSINAQMAGMSHMDNARANATYTTNAGIEYISKPVYQPGISPMAVMPSDYPVCDSDRSDSCINPYAAGLRGPNVERPLPYWPGEGA